MRYSLLLRRLLKEVFIFFVIMVLLALLLHPDLLTEPLERIKRMVATQNYMHALSFTAVVYIVLGVFRLFFGLVLLLKSKKS